jgi:hypothetical protein
MGDGVKHGEIERAIVVGALFALTIAVLLALRDAGMLPGIDRLADWIGR